MHSRLTTAQRMFGCKVSAENTQQVSLTTWHQRERLMMPLLRAPVCSNSPTPSVPIHPWLLEVTGNVKSSTLLSQTLIHGVSQGAALIAGAVPTLSSTVIKQIKGIVLFGYTRNKQNNGGIPSYPQSNLAVYCADGDLVCDGTLIVLPAHSTYEDEAADEAPKFLESKIGA